MKTTLPIAGIALASLVAVSTSEVLEQGIPAATAQDSVPLTRPELYTYFSNRTQLRADGHTYYSDLGTFQALIDNEIVEGTWSSHEGGKMCRHFEKGDDGICEVYVFDGESVNLSRNGIELIPPEMVDGNTAVVKDMLTPEQTTELVSGKTALWPPNGGAYYAPDGTLVTLWDGAIEEGTWEVNEEGGVCWKVPSWGNTPCEFYYRGEEGLMAIYGSEEGEASEHVDGNVLDTL